MIKIAEEANMMIIEIEETILKASINNWTVNTMNILRFTVFDSKQYKRLSISGSNNVGWWIGCI